MRNSILVILALLLNACGGEAFSAEFDSVGGNTGGEAGDTTVTAGGSVTAGTASTGGMAAGQHAGGNASGGIAAAGAPTGGAGGSAPVACELDVAKLTAALPTELTWQSFDLRTSDLCVICVSQPCGKATLAWEKPVVENGTVTYQVSYTPHADSPMVVRAGKNDGVCASQKSCELKPTPAPTSLTVTRQDDGWVVSKVAITVWFLDDSCTSTIGQPGYLVEQLDIDLQSEMAPLLTNLKIPCE